MSFFRPITKLIIIPVSFLLVAGIIGWLTLKLLTSGGDILIPDVVGRDLVSGMKILQDQRLYGVIADEQHHPEIPRGCVIAQDPGAREVKKAYSSVRLTLSSGPELLKMIDMRGFGVRQARLECAQFGLGGIHEITAHHPSIPAGSLIAHVPGPDDLLFTGNPVKLLVSIGTKPSIFRMPDFIGQPVEKANEVLSPFFIPQLEEISAQGIDPGTVIGVIPAPGEPLLEGMTVRIQVARNSTPDEIKPALFIFRMPQGLMKKRLTITLTAPEGKRTVYDKNADPSEEVKLFLPKTGGGTLEVSVDGTVVKTETW